MNINNSINALMNRKVVLESLLPGYTMADNGKKFTSKALYPPGADSVSIDEGKRILSNHKYLSSITSINGHDVKKLAAVDNTLDFTAGSYYKLTTKSGITAILTSDDEGDVYMPFSELGLVDPSSLGPSDYKEIDKAEKFLTYLSTDMTGFYVKTGYSNSEIKENLDNAGIKPGWFEIKNSKGSNKFYVTDEGDLYPKYQVDAQIDYFNMKNFFKDGYTKDSVFNIYGKEYKLDDTGHLHVPEGIGCVWEHVEIQK